MLSLFNTIVSITHRIFGPIGWDPVELGRGEICGMNYKMDRAALTTIYIMLPSHLTQCGACESPLDAAFDPVYIFH